MKRIREDKGRIGEQPNELRRTNREVIVIVRVEQVYDGQVKLVGENTALGGVTYLNDKSRRSRANIFL